MIGHHRAAAAGRGLLLVPSVFAYKPVPPISAHDPPWLAYPARGVGTLWAPTPPPDTGAPTQLLGPARAKLLRLLGGPTATAELARRQPRHPRPQRTVRALPAQPAGRPTHRRLDPTTVSNSPSARGSVPQSNGYLTNGYGTTLCRAAVSSG